MLKYRAVDGPINRNFKVFSLLDICFVHPDETFAPFSFTAGISLLEF